MSLIFNSITQFEIQPERTKKRAKRDDLDTLSEVWVGPSALEDTFVPAIGTVHHDFSLMTVIASSIKRLPMYVSEVTIEYHGKLDNYGTTQYTSVPTISQHWAEGEVSMGSGGTTISRRYTGRCVQIDYLTNRRPTGNPTNIGLAQEFLGFTNVWDQVTSFGSSATIIGPPIKKLSCTDVKIDDKADGWYRVTETYQSRMYPGVSISGAPGTPTPPAGPIATKIYGPFPLFGGADWYGMNQNTQNPQTQRATGSAQQAATSTTTTTHETEWKSTTIYGSPAADTAQQTAIDPGMFTSDTAGNQVQTADTSPILSAAASANYSDAQTPDQGTQSASLPY
jgi:hypothetical protein